MNIVIGLVIGVVLGAGGAAVLVRVLLPRLMIVTRPSRLSFDETVAAVQGGAAREGWSVPNTLDLKANLAKKGENLKPRVTVVQLCKAPYARSVLETDRHVSCLMPCSFGVWEGDDGRVRVSKMNTGLIGRLFGGNVSAVMSGRVAGEEASILKDIAGP